MNTTTLFSNILAATVLASCTSAPARSIAQANVSNFESDASGFNTKTFFYDNGEEVVVFDTQFTPDLAKQAIAMIQRQTSNPITTVVITHPNPDKFNGAVEFQKLGARVISSQATAEAIPGVHAYKKAFFVSAKMFTEETYPRLAQIDETFTGNFDLKLKNGEVVQLKELAQPGVSSTQTVAYVPRAKALFVGDLVHHKAHAWLEGGIVNGKATPTLKGWIADLNQIAREFPADTEVFGGRGESAKLATAVETQISYLKKADAIVSKFAKAKNADFAQMTKAFEQSLPDYQLSYMIQYGAYGLYNSK